MQVSVSYVPRWLVPALLVCLFLPVPVTAASDERVGRVMIAMGSVTAEREGVSMRGLGRRDAIHAGDRIRTGPRGRAQIRFQDGGMVDLEADSIFEVEEYSDDDDGGSVVMSFLKGAMRTITGAIGSNSGDSYRMNTSVATLGVRGTAYSLRYCDAACAQTGGEAGLYGRVDDGEVVVDGPGGTGGFGAGQFFFVPDGGTPRRIVAPPDGILDGDDGEGADGDDEEAIEDVRVRPVDSDDEDGAAIDGEGDDLLDPGFEQGENEDLRSGVSIDAAFSGAYVGSSGFAVFESPGEGDVRRDEEGRIVGAEFGDEFIDASGMDHVGGMTEITPIDEEDGGFEVSWGSWTPSGPVDDGDLRGFVYAYTDPGIFTTATELGVVADAFGSLQYTNLDGPPALGSDGTRWDVSALQLDVSFTDSSIAAAGILLSNQANSDEGIDLNAGFQDQLSVGVIDPDTTFTVSDLPSTDEVYSGDLTGRFIGRNAEGALVAFEVRELDGDRRIVGTRLLSSGGGLDGDIIDGDPLVN